MDCALAPSTSKIYSNNVEKFKTFCRNLGRKSTKIFRDDSVELWLSHLNDQSLRCSTIRSRLSALKHYCTTHNISSELDTKRIKLILQGLKKVDRPRKSSTAVATICHLKRLSKASKETLTKNSHYRFTAMITIAFYGFLRPSEYCITSAGHNVQWNNVTFGKRHKSVRLKLKSFKHSKGKKVIQIGRTTSCCPVRWITKYMSAFKDIHRSSLFEVSGKEFRNTLRQLCSAAHIKTQLTPHSFRHGGASWASKQGWPDARIKAHGRWTSDAYKKYVRAF